MLLSYCCVPSMRWLSHTRDPGCRLADYVLDRSVFVIEHPMSVPFITITRIPYKTGSNVEIQRMVRR